MKTAVTERYGSPDLIEIRDTPRPVAKAGEVLVKVHVSTVNRTDCGMLSGIPLFARPFIGLWKPKITVLGMDFAGVVEAVGSDVAAFKTGDSVFGMSPDKFGAHAEYLCIAADKTIAALPTGKDFEDCVVCEGNWYADVVLQKFNIRPGQKILIYGASGAIGIAALQLAKAYGAEVTAVIATRHLDLARSLGADHLIDYTEQDFTAIEDRFDFVFDAVGKTSYPACRKLLKPNGQFSATDLGPWGQNIFLSLWCALIRSNRVIFPTPAVPPNFMQTLKTRIEAGQIRAVIDRRYTLDQIVEAYHYVKSEQKTGIVILKIAPPV